MRTRRTYPKRQKISYLKVSSKICSFARTLARNTMSSNQPAKMSFNDWEKSKILIQSIEIPFSLSKTYKNSRLTTTWGCLQTAKAILESGCWNQQSDFRWKLKSQEDWERYGATLRFLAKYPKPCDGEEEVAEWTKFAESKGFDSAAFDELNELQLPTVDGFHRTGALALIEKQCITLLDPEVAINWQQVSNLCARLGSDWCWMEKDSSVHFNPDCAINPFLPKTLRGIIYTWELNETEVVSISNQVNQISSFCVELTPFDKLSIVEDSFKAYREYLLPKKVSIAEVEVSFLHLRFQNLFSLYDYLN